MLPGLAHCIFHVEKQSSPNSASAAEDITCLMMLALTRMAPFIGGMGSLESGWRCGSLGRELRQKHPPSLLLDFGADEQVGGVAMHMQDHV